MQSGRRKMMRKKENCCERGKEKIFLRGIQFIFIYFDLLRRKLLIFLTEAEQSWLKNQEKKEKKKFL